MQVLVEDLQIGDHVTYGGFVEHVADAGMQVSVTFNTRASALFPKGETLAVEKPFEFALSTYPVSLALYHWNMGGVATPISGDKQHNNKEK